MSSKTKLKESKEQVKRRPPISPEAQENEMISLAFKLARQQMIDGTASAQVITHFLKQGTEQTKLERIKLEKETKLLDAKTANLESAKRVEELYENALEAMKKYSGHGDDDEDESIDY